jgi:hypothetical protein
VIESSGNNRSDDWIGLGDYYEFPGTVIKAFPATFRMTRTLVNYRGSPVSQREYSELILSRLHRIDESKYGKGNILTKLEKLASTSIIG